MGRRTRFAAATLAIAAAVDGVVRDHAALGSTASVSVSSTSLGVTPQLLGYNMGHYMPGSNTSAWLKYSNANAFRYWAASDDYEPTDDMPPYGDGVTTQSQFDSRKISMLANPESRFESHRPQRAARHRRQHFIVSDPIGRKSGTSYTGVTGLIAAGKGTANAWNGATGIVTSSATTAFTTLAVSTAAQAKNIAASETAVWSGQTVSGSDTLIMFTYGGDATLDGKLNIDDYVRIDSGIANNAWGYANGDLNYDGKVNIDDYTVIDTNLPAQTAPFPSASAGSGVTAIPEPATVCLLIPLRFLRRRCRRCIPSPAGRG